MSPERPAGSESLLGQKRTLNGSIKPSTIYSATSLPTKSFTPHRPSLLRHASGIEISSPATKSTLQVVINSSPPKSHTSNTLETPSIKKRGRPFANKPAQEAPFPISTGKKRGRPFRTPEAAAAALAKAKSSSVNTLKKRGRPFKYAPAQEKLPPIEPPEPKFVPFICEWQGCPAELHNLSTLRAHLQTVHLKRQPREGPFACRWKRCCLDFEALDKDTGEKGTVQRSIEFKTKEEWKSHVEKTHLDRVAWYQGDGPKAAMEFFAPKNVHHDPHSYLYHDNGSQITQVTPRLDNQPIEQGRAKDNNSARFKKERDGLYVILVPKDEPALNTQNGLDP